MFLTEPSHLSAFSSKTWRTGWTGWTWRALFAWFAFCSLWHFDAGGSATNLGRLAHTTLALVKGRESRRLVCMTVKPKHVNNNNVYTAVLTFSPLRPGRPRPGSPWSPCQKINIMFKWHMNEYKNGVIRIYATIDWFLLAHKLFSWFSVAENTD